MAVFLRIIQIKVFFEALEDRQKIPVVVIGVGKAPEIACHGIPISKLLEVPGDQIREIDRAEAFLFEKGEPADQHADECAEYYAKVAHPCAPFHGPSYGFFIGLIS
jgi:hypothetical protein